MISFLEWCKNNKKEQYLLEWDVEANGNLTPENVSYGSIKYDIQWKCSFGHTWTAKLNNRTTKKNSSCPYCAGKKVLTGFNDLSTVRPEIAAEWAYSKNDSSPRELVQGSNKKVWWLCPLGHSYAAAVVDRTKAHGTGCPYCAGQRVLRGFNDLENNYPLIAKQWDYDKNNNKPYEVSSHSGKLAYWICEKGHEYEVVIRDRVDGNSCPYCAGKKVLIGFNDLQTVNPDIAAEWDYEMWKWPRTGVWQGTRSGACASVTTASLRASL